MKLARFREYKLMESKMIIVSQSTFILLKCYREDNGTASRMVSASHFAAELSIESVISHINVMRKFIVIEMVLD